MKAKPLSPFQAGEDHTNACVNFSRDMSCGYTEGYRLAADLLTTHVATKNRDHDFLVYPICYLYRHHLELQLKQIIRIGRRLLDQDGVHPQHHKLSELWPLAKGILRQAEPGHPDPAEFRLLDNLIEEFADVDYDAQAFRFPNKSRGEQSLTGLTHINLSRLRESVETLASFLWGCEAWLSEMLHQQYEMEREFGP